MLLLSILIYRFVFYPFLSIKHNYEKTDCANMYALSSKTLVSIIRKNELTSLN